MLDKNQKVIVNSDHEHHPNRVGYFRFYTEEKYNSYGNLIEPIAVFSTEPHETEDGLMTLFCISQGDYDFIDSEKHEFESDTPCVHTGHCCATCGCKYGSDSCPVWLGYAKQEYGCYDGFGGCQSIKSIPHSEFIKRREKRKDKLIGNNT